MKTFANPQPRKALKLALVFLTALAPIIGRTDQITNGVYQGDLSIQPDAIAVPTQFGDLSISGSVDILGPDLQLGSTTESTYSPGVLIQYSENGTSYSLTINATRANTAFLWKDNGASTTRTKMQIDGSNVLSLFNANTGNASISFDPNASKITILGPSGNPTSPAIVIDGSQSKVTINGQAILAPNASGNVGIGTTTPADQLEITGNLRIPATTSPSNGVIMRGGTRLLHTYGTDNLFIGPNAGNFLLTGQANTAVGTRALDELTSGTANIALGADALGRATSGGYNLAIGTRALEQLTTAANNVAVGAEALRNTTTSWANVAIGQYALMTFNGGGGTAIGYAAGQWTTGYGPTFIGAEAGLAITNGWNNTAIGNRALFTDGTVASTNGNLRTAIGAFSQVTSDRTIALGGVGQYAADAVLGGTSASAKLHVIKNAEQLRLAYDAANYLSTSVQSTGAVQFNSVGSGSRFTFRNATSQTLLDVASNGDIRIPKRQGDILMGEFGNPEP